MARVSNKQALPESTRNTYTNSLDSSNSNKNKNKNNSNNDTTPVRKYHNYAYGSSPCISALGPQSSGNIVSLDELNQLKKKYLLQNKVLATRNEELLKKITALENRLLTIQRENLALRNNEIKLRESLDLYSMKFENQIITKFEDMMTEFINYQTSLGIDRQQSLEKYRSYIPTVLRPRKPLGSFNHADGGSYLASLDQQLKSNLRRKSIVSKIPNRVVKEQEKQLQKRFEEELYMNQDLEIRDFAIPEVEEGEEEGEQVQDMDMTITKIKKEVRMADEIPVDQQQFDVSKGQDLSDAPVSRRLRERNTFYKQEEGNVSDEVIEVSSAEASMEITQGEVLDYKTNSIRLSPSSKANKESFPLSESSPFKTQSPAFKSPVRLVINSSTTLLPESTEPSPLTSSSFDLDSPFKKQPSMSSSGNTTEQGQQKQELPTSEHISNSPKKDTQITNANNHRNPFIDPESSIGSIDRSLNDGTVSQGNEPADSSKPKSHRRKSWLDIDPLSVTTTGSRKRRRKSINYQEPPLSKKLRRESDKFVDAVTVLKEDSSKANETNRRKTLATSTVHGRGNISRSTAHKNSITSKKNVLKVIDGNKLNQKKNSEVNVNNKEISKSVFDFSESEGGTTKKEPSTQGNIKSRRKSLSSTIKNRRHSITL